MNTTMPNAVDEIFALLNAAWTANTPPYNVPAGTPVEIRWPNDDAGGVPAQTKPWARVVLQHTSGGQYSLGTPGNRLWEHEGLVVVQIYVPVGRGLATARQLCMIAKNAFEGTSSPSGVWFRNCHFQEIGQDPENPEMKAWDQSNVLCQFVYDEQR
jgi:hypothetical protein